MKQLYNSVLHAIKTIASSRDDFMPELTKTFFENILRASDDSPKLQVTKVKVKDGTEFGRHFCSAIHAVEVTAKVSKKYANILFSNTLMVPQRYSVWIHSDISIRILRYFERFYVSYFT